MPSQTLSNGYTSPLANPTPTNDDAPHDSESDLSEVAIPAIDDPSPATSTNHQSVFGAQDTEDSESSSAEAQHDSDDADFDIEESPAPVANGGHHDRSTSIESRRPAKRKLGVKEDEHILANPELYGLRRSVRYQHVASPIVILTYPL
jgi:chromodomain-helicase-DNA-binding protein 1